MAVVVGLVAGFAAGFWRRRLRFAVVALVPLGVAAIEIIVNTARFGVTTMVVWAPILLALTVAVTAAALAFGRWLSRRTVG